MKFEVSKAGENLIATTDEVSGERFVSRWNLDSKREYPKKEVDSCGCGCPSKA